MDWADECRRLKVRANADTPLDAAHGARVRRRGHRPVPHRAHVLRRRPHRRRARDDPGRRRGGPPRGAGQDPADAARRLRRAVRDHGGPAGDHPPARPAAARVPAARPRRRSPRSPRRSGVDADKLLRRARTSCTRSTRCSAIAAAGSAITYPEITRCRSARSSRRPSRSPRDRQAASIPEIMIPLVATRQGARPAAALIDAWPKQVIAETGVTLEYLVGTMIELPRAALRADEIAETAEFFSFGTNDLTQTTFGISRDDAGRFLGRLYREGHLRERSLRQPSTSEGVGELIRIAAERGRSGAAGPQARHLRRARRRPGLDRLLRARRPRLLSLLALPRADRPAGRGAGRAGSARGKVRSR